MEEESKGNSGIATFNKFLSSVPEGLTTFDYFVLLDHISQNKVDKDLIAAIFCESINSK